TVTETPAKSESPAKPPKSAPVEVAPATREFQLGRDAQPVETLKEGSMSAMLGGVMDRLSGMVGPKPRFKPKLPPAFQPEESARRGGTHGRTVRCFECNHQQAVSNSATSTQCERCSVYISLVDYDITSPWSQNIRTRGNVHIRRRGEVVGCDIACHDLEVSGKVSASVDCSGNAVFHQSARIMGSMYCRHLHVDKRREVIFPQGVVAESADIYGTVRGNITCSGTIRIFKSGKVEGNAVAKSIDLKDGGVLSGRMSIQPKIDITLPEKKGYLKKD
ncbi:MAG: polymer-forming cytoskeletal protein, partial [Verrucomicrobiae bacterium]|nr:polymer-forming cytoskeletal protein [Verrucomicrobiae bacterium]